MFSLPAVPDVQRANKSLLDVTDGMRTTRSWGIVSNIADHVVGLLLPVAAKEHEFKTLNHRILYWDMST